MLKVLSAGVVAAGAAAASALGTSTADRVVHFVTPDREIECVMVFDPFVSDGSTASGNVHCGIHRNRLRVSLSPGNGFDLERPSRRWTVFVDGPAVTGLSRRRFTTIVDLTNGGASGSTPARVLRRRQTVKLGVFRCSHRTDGVTCLSTSSGHGFTISDDVQRRF
jgi:hypothetical protein